MSDTAAVQHGYAGYHYQKVASVWLALKWMFQEERCDAVTVEPASEEDIAANLMRPDAMGVMGAEVAGILLEVQIKSRNSNWTSASFRRVLVGEEKPATGGRGPAPRVRPLKMLQAEARLFYLFVTNAQLDADLTAFKIERAGARGTGKLEEKLIPAGTPETVWPRIGIFPELSLERLELEITVLLKQCAHVPHGRIAGCKERLFQAVQLRFLGRADRGWSKTEAGEVLLQCGGTLESSSAIVPPANFAEMQAKLTNSHSLLLIGEPGVGKTAVARELARQLTLEAEPFELVHGVGSKPSVIATALAAPGAHVFLFEDPWGGEKLADDAELWMAELPKLMRKASPEKRFIITSRESIRHEAMREAKIPVLIAAELLLEAKHYPAGLRLEIVNRQMADAAPWQQDWVARYRKQWLQQLLVPLSLDHLCDRVKGAGQADELVIDDLLQESAVGTLSQTCSRELRSRGDETVAGALALWALQHVHNRVTDESAAEGRELIMTGGYRRPIDPVRTFHWLVKAGWFKQASEGFMAHPTCLSGIGQFLAEEPALAEDTLQAMLKGLADANRLDEAFLILRHLARNPRAVTKSVRSSIESHLVGVFLAADASSAKRAMSDITIYSTATDPVTVLLKELGRLDARAEENFGFEVWRYNSSLTKQQRAQIAGSADAERAAGIFVMHVLPEASIGRYNAQALVHFFQKFGWDFGPQFQALANVLLADADHTHPLLDVFVEGALCSERPPFESLLTLALAADDASGPYLDKYAKDRESAGQSEWDAGRASDLDDELQGYWVPRVAVLRDVVTAKCRHEGFAWIESHPRRDDLLHSWADGMSPQTPLKELLALIDWCGANRRSTTWHGVMKSKRVEMRSVLIADLGSCPLEELAECGEAVACLVPLPLWPEVTAAVAALPFARKAVLVTADLFQADDKEERRKAWRDTMQPAEIQAVDIARNANPNKALPVFDADAGQHLRTLAGHATPELAAKAAYVLGRGGIDVADVVDRLSVGKAPRVRLWVALAAMLSRPPVWGRAKARRLLSDDDYKIRRLAMRVLFHGATPEDENLLLGMSKDRSAPVRECCAEIIGEGKWAHGESVLAMLLEDRRNKNPSPGFERSHPEYHVARAAAGSLLELGRLQTCTIDRCVALVKENSTARDIELHCTILRVLAAQKDSRLLPLFASLLQDDWFVEAEKDSGYTRRYFAGWGLLELINAGNESDDGFDATPIVEGAMHNDPRLVAPCLVLLAYYAESAAEAILAVLSSPLTSELRALLILSCMSAEATSDTIAAARKKVGENHPAYDLIQAPAPPDATAWNAWLVDHPRTADWLKTIQTDTDVIPTLRWALGRRCKAFRPDELRYGGLNELLPKGPKYLTTWSMFHE